ncbi:hypothetical protein [Serinicoccus kebangsaanensis]|uniref:hypothetical protein n=1 Tax=Serinicoccus kebangsaanensis TaxID=2602069 RepID=UPI00124E45E4|nr:hypothetical protein [Serinicoccus kebangsaanensis]
MGRHTARRRHSDTPPSHWTHLLAGVPWITLVLVLTLLGAGWELVRPRTYTALATITATDERAADRASVRLTDPSLEGEVEAAVELDPELADDIRLEVRHRQSDPVVRVVAHAPDPRLAALAADTAAALEVQDGEGELEFTAAAEIPTQPTDRQDLRWLLLAGPALVAALWVEGAHRAWLRDRSGRLDAVAEAP